MKSLNLFRSLLLSCLCILTYTSLQAQFEITEITYDPLRRANKPSSINTNFGRVSKTGYKDTLELPFFEDFTQATAPIDTVFTNTGSPIRIKTQGTHGLKDGDRFYLQVEAPNNVSLTGNYWAKKISKSEFQLSQSSDLASILISDGSPITADFVYWTRPGAQLGPNPDTLKWEDDGGAYISDRIAKQPPSIYVATFDALDANGNLYINSTSGGKTDFLMSQSINLSGMTADSNIVLSFYLQGGGYGFTPLSSDSLYLEFKDKDGIWRRVWGHRGALLKFQRFTVNVSAEIYFHISFQFRFQNYTAMNGSVSKSYNVDYIYLDKNWNESKDFPLDAAINERQTNILKKYAAMPSFQFDPERNLADSVTFSIRNNSNQVTGVDFIQNYVYNDGTQSPDNAISVGFPQKQSSIKAGWKVDKTLVKSTTAQNAKDTTLIKYKVNVLTGDKLGENRIQWNMNNRDSSTVALSNYYAFDDGSAEANFAIRGSGGRVLLKFNLNKVPDTITHIDIFNPLNRLSLQGGAYLISKLVVADSERKVVTDCSTEIVLKYPEGRNIFSRYKLKNPFIATSNEMYVGYDQNNGLEILYGMDMNTPSTVFFYNATSKLEKEEPLGGTLMIRPVLRSTEPTVGTERSYFNQLACDIYPNPATEQVSVTGDVANVEVYTPSGLPVLNQKFSAMQTDKTLDVSTLPNGLYMVKMSNAEQQAVKKLVVAR